MEGKRLGYRSALDGVRAIAVLAVAIVHSWPALLPNGWLGVDVFFVLSGFLITSLLVEEWVGTRGVGLVALYGRRALRLLPALAVVIPAGLLVSLTMPGETASTLRQAVSALVFGANWFEGAATDHGDWHGVLGHLWSLSVEEQFYLVWPLLLLAMLRLGGVRWALRLSLLSLGAVVVHRTLNWGGRPDVYFRTDMRADALLVGCALALLAACSWRPSHRTAVVLTRIGGVGLLAIAMVPRDLKGAPVMALGGFTVVAILGAGAVAGVVWAPPRILSGRPLVYVGRISYGLYLWNILVAVGSARVLGLGYGPATLALTVVGGLALASASYRYLERPIVRRFGGTRLSRRPAVREAVAVVA